MSRPFTLATRRAFAATLSTVLAVPAGHAIACEFCAAGGLHGFPILFAAADAPAAAAPAAAAPNAELLRPIVDREYPSLERLYRDVHANPELSLHEARTAKLLADELRAAGYEVT